MFIDVVEDMAWITAVLLVMVLIAYIYIDYVLQARVYARIKCRKKGRK